MGHSGNFKMISKCLDSHDVDKCLLYITMRHGLDWTVLVVYMIMVRTTLCYSEKKSDVCSKVFAEKHLPGLYNSALSFSLINTGISLMC